MKNTLLLMLFTLLVPNITFGGGMNDDPLLMMVTVDQLEIRHDNGDSHLAWEADGWLGKDLNKLWIKTEGGRLAFDKFMLRTPMFGTLIRKSAVARFTRTLGTLLQSGVSILDALDITAKTAGNKVIQIAIRKSVVAIAEGDTITGPLKESGVFPPMVTQMIHVGEKTGGLDDMLGKIADFYDEEVDAAVSALTSIIEPVIIVLMGIVIGGILIAMYMPMFDIIGKIS